MCEPVRWVSNTSRYTKWSGSGNPAASRSGLAEPQRAAVLSEIMASQWSVCGVLAVLFVAGSCTEPGASEPETAERFFRAVYGCTGETLDSLASAGVRMSYPIFAERLGMPVLEGRDAVQQFSAGFCQRWRDPEVVIHEVVSDPGRVVLVWSYSALAEAAPDSAQTRASWGGISVFEFDAHGRVVAEYGEESTPGPEARMSR